jgi:hypothetical protein
MSRSKRAQKLSVSVPHEVAVQVKKRAGKRGLSAFVTRALEHELEHERLGQFLRELEAEIGPADEELVGEMEELFR